MKIAVIVDNELNSDKRVLREIAILREAGHNISVLCFGFKTVYSDPLTGIIVSRIRIRKKLKDILFFFQNLVPAYEIMWTRRISLHISEFDPDVIHVHDLYMAKAGRLGIRKSGKEIPMILDLHENYPYAVLEYNWTKGIIRRLLSRPRLWIKKEKTYLLYADGIVVLSTEFRDALKQRYAELENIPVAAYPNVPDLTEEEAVSTVDLKLRFRDNKSVVFYYGVVAERRGIFDVLAAFRLLAEEDVPARFLVIGPVDKKDRELFFSIINSGKLKNVVTYIPWIDSAELPAYLRITDICISPLLKNPHHESGIANKVFDYMLGKKPVIASDCKPQKNLIEKCGCGIVYSNPEELKGAIIRLSENPNLRAEMGEKGYQAVIAEYNTGVLKHNLTGLYSKIMLQTGRNNNTEAEY